MRERWYDRSREELLSLLQTDGSKGLSRSEAAARLKTDGKNTVNPVLKAPIRGYILQVISDLSAILMLGVALLALIFRRDMGTLMLLILLLVNYTLTVISYIRAQKKLEDMGYRAQPTARVVRQGKVMTVPAESLVMGDILLLSYGDIVPCDARLLESEDLRIMENILFSTDRPTKKDADFQKAGILKPEKALNMVYASTVVSNGIGRAVVVETGEETLVCRLGKNKPIAACHKLNIIKELKKISSVLSVLLVLPVFFLTFSELVSGGKPVEAFLVALAFAVAAIPEMYTAFAYSVVSFGMKWALGSGKNDRTGVFIKNPLCLPALCETDCIMMPLECFYEEGKAELGRIYDGKTIHKLGKEQPSEKALRILRYGLISTGLYGSVRLNRSNERSENIYTQEQNALISAGERLGVYTRELEDRYPILDHRDKGENGSHFETTLVNYKGQDVVVTRGTPEEVLARCSFYCSEGKIYNMDAFVKNELEGIAGTLIKDGCTPLAIATKNSNYNNLSRIVDCQSEMTFEGFLAIEKPIQQGAVKQIRRMRDAGIRVIAYSEEENAGNKYLAGMLGLLDNGGTDIRASQTDEMSEEIFAISLEKCGLLEGFDSLQLQKTVELLSELCDRKVGFFAITLDGISPMYSADVGFSKEEGKRLGRVSEREQEIHTPLFAKKDKAGRTAGCQALNYESDVILPRISSNGNGGINSLSRAIRAARFIYRNIGILLFYLAFTCCLRFTALLFGPNGQYLSAVQMLVSGMIFDFLSVFVIALEYPDNRFIRYRARKGRAAYIKEILPAAGLGVCFSAAAILFAKLLQNGGVLADGAGVRSFFFSELLFLQTAMLLLLLRTGRTVLRDVRLTGAKLVWALLPVGFFAVCSLFPEAGKLFSFDGIGIGVLLLALVLPAVMLLFGIGTRIVMNRKKQNGGAV